VGVEARGFSMGSSLLVRVLGFPATLIHGDTLVVDRWNWLKARLPRTRNGERLIDIGCGSGAFSIGAARRGYKALGLSWDEANQAKARERAALAKAPSAGFDVLDVRRLASRPDLTDAFEVAICCENIEHILDDRKLMIDIAACLKPGGRLLLTAPNYHYRSMTPSDDGPFPTEETGWHVRRGYSVGMLRELCDEAGLIVEEVSSCSGFFSQKVTTLLRLIERANPILAWGLTLPLRILPLLLDGLVRGLFRWPDYSICLQAYKPRYAQQAKAQRAPTAASAGRAA
jgi:SAM-dependent methyltransferase